MSDRTGSDSQIDRESGSPIANNDLSLLNRRVSPGRILITTIVGIFLAEIFGMFVLAWLPEMPYALETLLDGLIMIILIFPLLYYLIFRSLFVQMEERERAEQAVRQSEALLRKVLENLPVGVWIIDQEGQITHGNPASQKIWAGARYVGIPQYGEYKGWWLESGEPIASEEWAAARAITRGEISLNEEVEIECFDSTHKIILNSAVPIHDEKGAIRGAIVVNQDITEHKRSDQLFRTALETLPVGVWITDEAGKIIYGNPTSQQIWAGAHYVGIDQFGEYKGWWLNTGKRIAPEEWAVARAIQNGETSLNEEIEIECFDGTHKIILNSARPILNERQRILGAFVVNQDITQRKRAEQALIQTSELLERYFSSIDTLIAYMDLDFNFIRVNDTYARSGGHPVEYFIGKNHFDLYPHEENQVIFQRVVETGIPFSIFEKPFEYPEFPERGVTYWDWSLQPVKGPDGVLQGLVLSLVDVTERKQAKLQLERQNQDLRTLSEAEHRQRELAEGLMQSVIALSTSLQLEDVLNTVLDQIRRAVPFRGANIVLIEGKTLRVAGFRGFEDQPDSVAAMQRSYALDDLPLFQQIYSTHQPVLVLDTLEEAGWRIAPGMEWMRSYLAAPLIRDEEVIGVINLTSEQPGFFSQDTVAQLMAFAAPAALAVHNAQIYKDELTARLVAETLSAAAQALTQTLDLDHVIDTLLEHIGAIVHSDTAGVALLEGESRLATRAVRGYERLTDPEKILSIVVDADSSPLMQKLVSTRKYVLVSDTATSPIWQVLPGMEPIRSWLGVPLVAGDKVIGVVGLGKTETDYFTQQHIQWAEALVGQAAVAIQNAWLFEQVRASSERLQGLSHRLVEVQENERRYIASELHDEVGQALTTLIVGLHLIEKKAEQPEAVRAEVTEMGHILDTVIDDLHRLAMDLRPASLDYLGLEAALHQHVEMMSEKLGLEIQFAMTGIDERLPANIEIAFYRIVQEALNNVARHARATHVDVLITQREDCLALIIEDDGIGFIPAEATKGKRIGLSGMRERAEMLKGKLVIESIPGKGSTVLVEVPYANPDSHRR